VTFKVAFVGKDPSFQWQKNGVDIPGQTAQNLTLSSVTVADAGSYTVTVRNSAGSITSAAATLTVVERAPTISAQPVSQLVNPGDNVTFRVLADGTAPLSFQWQRNGTDFPGATSKSLDLSNVTLANAGSYTVRVSNSAGSITTPAATLTVAVTTSDLANLVLRLADDVTKLLARTTLGALTPGTLAADAQAAVKQFESIVNAMKVKVTP
jgi:hypothetical protein